MTLLCEAEQALVDSSGTLQSLGCEENHPNHLPWAVRGNHRWVQCACVQQLDESNSSLLIHLRELSLTTKGVTLLTNSSDSRWNMASWSGMFIPAGTKYSTTLEVIGHTFYH